MRVLIDCTQVTRTKAGVGVYALNTVRELVAANTVVTFLLLVQSDDSSFHLTEPNVRLVYVKSSVFRRLPFRFLMEQLWIPWLAFRFKVDVVHSLHYSFPLMPMRAQKVVTLHDMTMFLMPEVHEATKVRFFTFFIKQASTRADHLIFVSESCRTDFKSLHPKSTATASVVHLGRDPYFCRDTSANLVDEVRSRYGLTDNFILYVGTVEPRKNLARLIEAFARITQRYPDLLLAIAGKRGWMCDDLDALVQRLGLQDRVRFLGFIEESEKPILIRAARLFAYPSLYEGFGIPVLEALSCGTPVLSSNVSSMPEIAGDAALLVEPTSILQIAEALRILLEDEGLRMSMIARGFKRALQFDWRSTAEQTLKVYEASYRRGLQEQWGNAKSL